jgi:hypothetical protein
MQKRRKRAEVKYQSSHYPAKVREAAQEYGECRRCYRKLGKAALDKPKSSRIHKYYILIKHEYHRAGRRLAKLTGHAWKS